MEALVIDPRDRSCHRKIDTGLWTTLTLLCKISRYSDALDHRLDPKFVFMFKQHFFLGIFMMLVLMAGSSKAIQYPVDGIYFTFQSFRLGSPDLKMDNLFKDPKGVLPVSNYRLWFNAEKRYVKTDTSGVVDFGETPVWGYVENGTVHVLLNGKFHKILLFGTISYLLESYPKAKGQMSPVVTDGKTVSNYRLLDMNTGRFSTYEPGRLETLMKDDEELLTEFRSITSAKNKEKRMYSFIERYNQKHPLLPLAQ